MNFRILIATGRVAGLLVLSSVAGQAGGAPPGPTTNFAAHTAIKSDGFDEHERDCVFPAVPGLTMADFDIADASSATYIAKSRETAAAQFGFEISEGGDGVNWRDISVLHTQFNFEGLIPDTADIARAMITVDGAPFQAVTSINQYGTGDNVMVDVLPSPQQDKTWLDKLEHASVAIVALYDASGKRYGPWTFDTTAIRNVPTAIKGSRFSCN